MAYNRFLLGAMSGVAVTATGYYLYKKNQDAIDGFLRSQGIDISANTGSDFSEMKMEELVATKERLEDLIAEMEFAQKKNEKTTKAKTSQAAKDKEDASD